MTIVATIFEAFGGDTKLSNATRIPLSTVNSWKSGASGIPHYRRREVFEARAKAITPLSPEAIAYLTEIRRR